MSVPAGAAPVAPAPAACSWQVEKLPVPAGMAPGNVRVAGVDAQGNTAGSYGMVGSPDKLLRWSASGVEVVGGPGGKSFLAYAQNASGVVAGASYDSATGWSAYTHTPGKGFRQLTPPAGLTNPRAVDVNDRGDVLGEVENGRHPAAVVWRADGSTEVIAPTGAVFINPIALTNDGAVLVGRSFHLGVWRDGQLTKMPVPSFMVNARDLTKDGVLGHNLDLNNSWLWNPATGTTESFDGEVFQANDNGTAVGRSSDNKPTVWQGIGSPTTLPLPAGATEGWGNEVNSTGTVIGGNASGTPVRWSCR
ncbi:hypothetical protein JOF53_001014 [Crossiella equi]|uniref:Extracellular repeat, HAF family n=1 Tax=Crossiella equi TaxID=130796 RepID=A0ABS5A7C7_9PSEU|nr:hypothetical protein [Crossiella equi]MBP2472142.1 hypothetical protein [Crossiella equi]